VKTIKFINFFKEVRFEVGRIAWLGLKETSTTSLLILIAVVIAAFFFLMVDGAIYKIIGYILKVGG
jgi:preprotein translocase SecE subunit